MPHVLIKCLISCVNSPFERYSYKRIPKLTALTHDQIMWGYYNSSMIIFALYKPMYTPNFIKI